MKADSLVRDLMQTDVITVSPEDNAAEVERLFVEHAIGGAPVVHEGALCGVISRTDLLRNLVVGQSLAEIISDYYRDPGAPPADDLPTPDAGTLQHSRVKDLMPERLITVEASDAAATAARVMLEHRIHRVLVLEEGRLVGVLSSYDLLRLIAR